MDAWIDAITRLGFPIVMCAKAINNNTQALIALKETMKKGE